MVAEMAHCEAACHLEDGDGEVHTSDGKGNLPEGESSGSENSGTSVADSSEEEEEEDGDSEVSEKDGEEEVSPPEPDVDTSTGEGHLAPTGVNSFLVDLFSTEEFFHSLYTGYEHMQIKSHCETCKAAQQSSNYEKVSPRRISKGQLQVQLGGEGTYECLVTGLVFEVSEPALVRYSILSWSKFGAFLQDSWRFAGPIFNVDVVHKDVSVLKSIQFPHSLCLADPDKELRFSVLHVKGSRPLIEPSADHSASHVKWCVSSLSPVAPIVQSSRSVEHHGVVLLYKELGGNNDNNFSFRIYLATNNSSDIKDIGKQVRSATKRYMKIDKPPTCKLEARTYRLISEQPGEIDPTELKFTLEVINLKGYFEAFFDQPPPFKLSLIETDSEATVWSATIREGDCVDNTVYKPRKRTRGDGSRKRKGSASEEEMTIKKSLWLDETDGTKTAVSGVQDMSEKQLLHVAKGLGNEWKEVAIFLGLSTTEVEDIVASEKSVTMQKHRMLVKWKSRQSPGTATAHQLLNSLEDLNDLPNEVHQLLQDMRNNSSVN